MIIQRWLVTRFPLVFTCFAFTCDEIAENVTGMLNLNCSDTCKNAAGAVVCTISCHMNDQDDPVVIRDSSPDLILLQMVTILQT
ncbi:hypothetical protein [Pseudomonas sp. LB3P31]